MLSVAIWLHNLSCLLNPVHFKTQFPRREAAVDFLVRSAFCKIWSLNFLSVFCCVYCYCLKRMATKLKGRFASSLHISKPSNPLHAGVECGALSNNLPFPLLQIVPSAILLIAVFFDMTLWDSAWFYYIVGIDARAESTFI